MALFGQNRIFHRRSGQSAPVRTRGLFSAALMAASVAMLVASRWDLTIFDDLRRPVLAWSAPVLEAASRVMAPANRGLAQVAVAWGHVREVGALRVENARLTALAIKLQDLQRENNELKRIAGFASGPDEGRLTARVVSQAQGPVSRQLLINAGRNQSIKDGYPVMGGDGLIGRIIQAHDNTAAVMLLGDRLSRVPVQIGDRQIRAVLSGTGGAAPKLEFIGADGHLMAGDLVTTSGLGGLFPRGLVVGRVIADGADWRVDLTGEIDAPGIVGVLLVDTPVPGGAATGLIRGERQASGPRAKDVVK